MFQAHLVANGKNAQRYVSSQGLITKNVRSFIINIKLLSIEHIVSGAIVSVLYALSPKRESHAS